MIIYYAITPLLILRCWYWHTPLRWCRHYAISHYIFYFHAADDIGFDAAIESPLFHRYAVMLRLTLFSLIAIISPPPFSALFFFIIDTPPPRFLSLFGAIVFAFIAISPMLALLFSPFLRYFLMFSSYWLFLFYFFLRCFHRDISYFRFDAADFLFDIISRWLMLLLHCCWHYFHFIDVLPFQMPFSPRRHWWCRWWCLSFIYFAFDTLFSLRHYIAILFTLIAAIALLRWFSFAFLISAGSPLSLIISLMLSLIIFFIISPFSSHAFSPFSLLIFFIYCFHFWWWCHATCFFSPFDITDIFADISFCWCLFSLFSLSLLLIIYLFT